MNKNTEMQDSHLPTGPAHDLMAEVLDAITRREWYRLPELAHPEIEVIVKAGPGVSASTNEHIWRSVHVRGRDELAAYLTTFFEALPSVAIVAEIGRPRDDCARVSTEASGVDNEGSPFDARAEIELCETDGRISSIHADIVYVAVGPDLLADGGGDPRRFFKPFLDQEGELLAVPAEDVHAA
jgi:hypothetical protein